MLTIKTQVDPRVIELLDLAAAENITLPLHAELIVWLEERGAVVDLTTGGATLPTVGLPTPSGKAVSYLLTPSQDIRDAFELGIMDRDDRFECRPQHYMFDEPAVREYVEGYNWARPVMTEAQIEAEAADYEEDQLDREFWAHSC